MNDIILAVIIAMIAAYNISAFTGEDCKEISELKADISAKDRELRAYYGKAINDALEAKKQARIEVAEAKKNCTR
jgi:hypothetical protein